MTILLLLLHLKNICVHYLYSQTCLIPRTLGPGATSVVFTITWGLLVLLVLYEEAHWDTWSAEAVPQPFVEGQSFKYPGWAGRLHHLSALSCLLYWGLIFSESLLQDLSHFSQLRLATGSTTVLLDCSLHSTVVYCLTSIQPASSKSFLCCQWSLWVQVPNGWLPSPHMAVTSGKPLTAAPAQISLKMSTIIDTSNVRAGHLAAIPIIT